jgi:pSer/pThr/pTyr-binding forkhead associated (FHA) protein
MGQEKLCMLFAPPRPPLRLDPEREVVIGRSQSCELTLHVGQASRRHAAVRFADDHYRVRDLDSTNGTLLNGELLETDKILRPGDRIEIGGTSVTFCQMDEAMEGAMAEPPYQGQTILMEPPTAGGSSGAKEGLRGNFEQIPSFAVLQILEMGSQTGLLYVETSEGNSWMWMENGRVVHCETEKSQGFEAAVEIVQSPSGRFVFEPGGQALQRSIDASVTELILEASRLADEAANQSV